MHRDEDEMDLEPNLISQSYDNRGPQQFSYTRVHKMIKSHKWSQRAQGLEDFLRYLILSQQLEQNTNQKENTNELMNQWLSEKDF